MSTPSTTPQGTCYRFTVESADQAAALIRDRLGPKAHVLSVRTVEAKGFKRLWASPRLEVVARVESDEAPAECQATGADTSVEQFPSATGAGFPSLQSLLKRAGVSDIAIGRLQGDGAWPVLVDLPLHRALVEVGSVLKRQSSAQTHGAPLNRAAFLSTAGSGRTTALCKWLGIEVFRNQRMGQVYAVEFDQPNPVGSLPMFCEALGVPFCRFSPSPRPAPVRDFVYFDMPRFSLGDSEDNALIRAFMNREKIGQRVLVLNVAYDHATLRAAYAAGRTLGATHLVFSHMDEAQQWGRAWDFLCDGALEPLFLSTGTALSGECTQDVWDAVVRKTLAAAGSGDAGDESQGARPVPGERAHQGSLPA